MTGQVKEGGFDSMVNGLCSGSVPFIYSGELIELQVEESNLVIFDAREKKEFNTSHIKGSSWVGYETFSKKRVRDFHRDQTVVVYCSVGYRSEKIGEQLLELGFKKVYNLYGGIFEWKNKGNEVVDQEDNHTEKVHAYNQEWGRWLENGIKVYD